MDSRARRIGENEVLYREVNAQFRALDARLPGDGDERYGFLCECGSRACDERIELSIAEYERIHEEPAQFVIVDGHEERSVESVVERHDDYAVVRKHEGGPAELAARHHEAGS